MKADFSAFQFIGAEEFCRKFLNVSREIKGFQVSGPVKFLVNHGHGNDPVLAFAEGFDNLQAGEFFGLKVEKGGDNLQVVLDPMVDFFFTGFFGSFYGFLCELFIGDVMNKPLEQPGFSLRVTNILDYFMDPLLRSVPAQDPVFILYYFFGVLYQFFLVRKELTPVFRINEVKKLDFSAKNFFWRVAENFFHSSLHHHRNKVPVQLETDPLKVLHIRAKAFFTFFQFFPALLLFRNVFHHTQSPVYFSFFVFQDNRTDFHVNIAAIFFPGPEFLIKFIPGFQGIFQGAPYFIYFFGMDKVSEGRQVDFA